MKIVEDQTCEGITIGLDNTIFVRCRFSRCVVLYGGGDVEFIDSTFHECAFRPIGPAVRVINTLQYFGFASDIAQAECDPPPVTVASVQ